MAAFDSAFVAGLDPSVASVLTSALSAGGTGTPTIAATPNARDVAGQILTTATSSQQVMDSLTKLGTQYGVDFSDQVANLLNTDPTLSGSWSDIATASQPYVGGPPSVTSMAAKAAQPTAAANAQHANDKSLLSWTLADLRGAMLGLLVGVVGFLIVAFSLYAIFTRTGAGASIAKATSVLKPPAGA